MADETTKVDEYDRQHGDPAKGKDMPPVTQDQAYGESLNPVRNPPPPYTNTKKVGGL